MFDASQKKKQAMCVESAEACSGRTTTDTITLIGYRYHHFGQHHEGYNIYSTSLQQSMNTQALL